MQRQNFLECKAEVKLIHTLAEFNKFLFKQNFQESLQHLQ